MLIGLGDSRHSRAVLNLLTFVCDVIIRVIFKVSFPQPDEILLQKIIFSCMRAIFCFFCSQVSPEEITPEIRFSKPYSRYSLFFKHLLNSVLFFK